GELHCVGATTLDEYRKHVEKDAALERRCQPILVSEPSAEDAIAILRGLKERYEVHHGIRIKDAALVAAAMLSSRYISDRKLPDKAIDLVDEAAARLRMEIDSLPVELDELTRRARQLEIEKQALSKESDAGSRERLRRLEEELAHLQEEADRLKAHWQLEKEAIDRIRGLKEKYEVHHGVKIKDSALVAAAVLSHRYIADRFLPDKAIDLIDEAASGLRIEIDSMPAELDEIERRIMQLEIERVSLAKETDDPSRERLEKLDRELGDLKERSGALKARWQTEKEAIGRLRKIKEEIDAARTAMADAERRGDLNRAAELRYGTLHQLERQLETENARLAEMQREGRRLLKEEVDEEDVAETVAKWTGIPVTRLLEGEVQKLVSMEERLARRVVGQGPALRAVANAVRRARSGLSDPNRPIGSFLFLGPTGVGKTELARALAEFLFDDERAMVRVDMSEYMEKHTVARLIGAPPGYVGFEEGGQLTEAVRRRPYSVVLFDEVEKAHPDVWNVLLQLLDDGRLTDGHGRTVDFRNTVVIMTSNLGSHHFREVPDPEKVKPLVLQELRQHLRPELLNRIDEVIVFANLGLPEITRIVDIQLVYLRKRLAERRIGLEVTEAAKALLAREGFDPVFGARPLKRTIQRWVQDPLALRLLEGEFAEGDTVRVDASRDELAFTKVVEAVPV
ncbi:MAG TPA: AAA family ATPase, partial [Methylomirabilota bacterium]|nr:AAA family ATPase [Methylomirabilota bacterium]